MNMNVIEILFELISLLSMRYCCIWTYAYERGGKREEIEYLEKIYSTIRTHFFRKCMYE